MTVISWTGVDGVDVQNIPPDAEARVKVVVAVIMARIPAFLALRGTGPVEEGLFRPCP